MLNLYQSDEKASFLDFTEESDQTVIWDMEH